MSIDRSDLVGAWRLVDWRIEYADGRVTRPFGNDAVGQLLYSADGHMSATVAAARRPSLGRQNARHAAASARAAAFDSYFHYAGRWRVDGPVVVHDVDYALNPGLAGTEQRREVLLEGSSLQLSATEAIGDGGERRHVLAWQRVAD